MGQETKEMLKNQKISDKTATLSPHMHLLTKEVKDLYNENYKTIIVVDLNTPLTSMDRSSRQKVKKEILDLKEKLDEMDLDIYRALYPKTADCKLFSSVHGTFSRIDHIFGNKASLNKFKKFKIITSIFSDHNAMKLEMNNENKNWESDKNVEIKQHTTEQQMDH